VGLNPSGGDNTAFVDDFEAARVRDLPLRDGNFETPLLPASPGFQYGPAGTGWTMSGGAGLSRNATGFTAGNPSAPEGTQVLFLQGVGSVSRTIDVVGGHYVFTFFAAQRGNLASAQRIRLRVSRAGASNGPVSTQEFTPAGAAYERFSSAPIFMSSGPHVVELAGLNPLGGDNTAFVDDVSATRVRDVGISGFESPGVTSASGFAYTPAGGPWTFTVGAGLTLDGSGFTASNPRAPEGMQVLFLQGAAASASIPLSIPHGGYYRFRLRAALRANGPTRPQAKNIRITAGGVVAGEFRLASTDYVELVSPALFLSAGATTVTLAGVDTAAGDHTGFVDDLRLEALHDWQDPRVWGGSVPGPSDDATVVAGSVVCLQGNLTPRSISVRGELVAVQNRDTTVTTKYVMVMGRGSRLEVGQELTPYLRSAVFTLNATRSDPDVMGMGNKFIGAMGHGAIVLHGQPRVSWTRLAANAAAGSTFVDLSERVDWQPGDRVVIVSSRRDWNEAERRTIATVQQNNTRLTLTSPLGYPHTGVSRTYGSGSRTWTADLRAEVGLLTHNIRVEGDSASEAEGFGGHIIIMDDSTAHVSGVELFNMGQRAMQGRYPFHWHLLGASGAGQYFRNSSIHQSYNRAITIHGTEGTLVDNNFFYDHIGHGVFLEDGSERFNVIRRNVALLTRRPAPGQEVTPSDNQFDEVQNRTPASYWITNPQNVFEDNVAAGTQGTGYWFAFPERPMGLSAGDSRFASLRPNALPLLSFRGNSAHSSMSGFDVFDGLDSSNRLVPNVGWADGSDHLIENGTWYATELAIYTGGDPRTRTDNLIFRNNVLVDNQVGTMLASYSIVEQSVFVADSGQNLTNGERYAYRVYDGAGQVRDSHFVGWDAARANLLLNTGAAIKHPNHGLVRNTTEPPAPPRASLEDFDVRPVRDTHANHVGHPRYWSLVLRDPTGTISGRADTSIVSNHPFMLVGDEDSLPNWVRTLRSGHRFVLSRLTYDVPFAETPNLTCTRERAGTRTVPVYYIGPGGFREWHQLPFIVNEGFEYTYTYETLPAVRRVRMVMEDAAVGDNYVARFRHFGRLGGIAMSSSQGSFPAHASLASLRHAASSGYFLEPGGDLFIKAVATGTHQSFGIEWRTDFAVPPLDTDGDQMTDDAELRASRHPFDPADLGAGFDTAGELEGWATFLDITGQAVAGGVLTGSSSNGGDAQIVNAQYRFSAGRVRQIQVRMRASRNTLVQLFFGTDTQPGSSGVRVASANYTGNGAYQTLVFDMSGHRDWAGTITQLRLDPVQGVGIQFDIDSILGPGSATAAALP
jgi:hypothetical protein